MNDEQIQIKLMISTKSVHGALQKTIIRFYPNFPQQPINFEKLILSENYQEYIELGFKLERVFRGKGLFRMVFQTQFDILASAMINISEYLENDKK